MNRTRVGKVNAARGRLLLLAVGAASAQPCCASGDRFSAPAQSAVPESTTPAPSMALEANAVFPGGSDEPVEDAGQVDSNTVVSEAAVGSDAEPGRSTAPSSTPVASSVASSPLVTSPPNPFSQGTASVAQAAACGDGLRGELEDCDDGNVADGDGCTKDCLIDPGFGCSKAGSPCVQISLCSDGRLSAIEQCDDHNLQSGDGCNDQCQVEAGSRCAGEPSQCEPNDCGDGMTAGVESCDDGNAGDGDGCDAECRIEPCSAPLGQCAATCGDGLVEGEECDDHNRLDGDGCSATCAVEVGYSCTDQPAGGSECYAVCGDGMLAVGEQCDDGANDGGYGECGPGCSLGAHCGDAIVQTEAEEECDVGTQVDQACNNCRIVR